jgi:DNA-binding transcriptional regulator LsrR (DeoR family)
MARVDELRLMARVARLYYDRGLRQSDIADQLSLSQATISRLLKRAEKDGIVRITVSVPTGTYPELEETLIKRYAVQHVLVADCASCDDEDEIVRNLGAAAAFYLGSTIGAGEVVGISSWSATLLATVDAMHPLPRANGGRVVQILGGASESAAWSLAVQLTSQLAAHIRGEATFLPAPAVVGSGETRRILLDDAAIRDVVALFDEVTLALVGIGALEPSPLLARSGNVFSAAELALLREQGAVGDVLARFYDARGRLVETELRERVIGMSLEQLTRVQRSVGVAGGKRKHAAIRGALLGGFINVLITDRFTAEWLVA